MTMSQLRSNQSDLNLVLTDFLRDLAKVGSLELDVNT
jgi:hypothetical protein